MDNLEKPLAKFNSNASTADQLKFMAEALRESEERYRILADTDSDVLVTIDEQGQILFANKASAVVFGYDPSELLGKKLALLIPEFPDFHHVLQKNAKAGAGKFLEMVGAHKSGEAVNLTVAFAEFLGQGKKYATGIIRDISEQKRIELALRETERKLQSVLASSPGGQIVAEAPAMLKLLERVKKSAASFAGILIQGETGSGKECIALSLHQQSLRSDKPFVARNCAAIPANLFESEMFGHKKGAFTGAERDRRGAFLEADGGTLFLDEIGDLEYGLQTKLLRAIQEKVIRPVGSDKDVPVDPRIICATNMNLLERCKTNQFREDLYYRLVTVLLVVPPLRERREDIIPLARHFIGLASKWTHELTPEAEARLLTYNWPGNVRELRSMMDQAVIFAASNVIEPDELAFPISIAGKSHVSQLLSDVERLHIIQVVKDCEGNKSDAAKILGMARSTLVLKLKEFPDELTSDSE